MIEKLTDAFNVSLHLMEENVSYTVTMELRPSQSISTRMPLKLAVKCNYHSTNTNSMLVHFKSIKICKLTQIKPELLNGESEIEPLQ
jgi:hypothetical protein